MVSVPVRLYSAIEQKDVAFHQIDRSSGSRVRYKRVSENTGREIPYERIAKGYEVSKGEYVAIDPKELEKYQPEATRRIDIEEFVQLDEIDPIYFEHTYYLAPDKGGDKAYRLLLRALGDGGKVGIGKVVIRGKQYLAAIRPYDHVLALETMLFHDEVRSTRDLPGVDGSARVSERELKMARQLIESLSAEFDPKRFRDDYREKVLALIRRKAKGKTIEIEEEAESTAAVVDLMEALKRSVQENSGRGGSSRRRTASRRDTAGSHSRRRSRRTRKSA